MLKILIFGLLGFSITNIAHSDECSHGAIHITLADGERIDDSSLEEPLYDNRPWYMHECFDYYGDYFNPTYEVEAESSWPSQREEFSDYLFR